MKLLFLIFCLSIKKINTYMELKLPQRCVKITCPVLVAFSFILRRPRKKIGNYKGKTKQHIKTNKKWHRSSGIRLFVVRKFWCRKRGDKGQITNVKRIRRTKTKVKGLTLETSSSINNRKVTTKG